MARRTHAPLVVGVRTRDPVCAICAHQRMQDGDALSLRRIFTGRCKRYEVGATHAQSLDPRNPVFASTLRRCVELIRAAAPAAREVGGTAPLPAEAR